MTDALLTLNHLVGIGTILMQAGAAALVVLYFLKDKPAFAPLARFVGEYGALLSFLIVLSGVVMSLVYSEYFGIAPCGLCWFQRIALYPQLIIFAVGAFMKDAKAWAYSIWLSVFGAATALYQHYLQMGGTDLLPCPATGAGDCAKRFLFEFNYITFPLVAFSTFALLIVIMLFVRARAREAKA